MTFHGSFQQPFSHPPPTEIWDVPIAAVHDSKDQLRFRAMCDERITLPLRAFQNLTDIYRLLLARLGQNKVVAVKMPRRCNHVNWWSAVAA